MSVTPVKTLVVHTGEGGVPVLPEPVRLVNPDGTPFTGAGATVTVETLGGASSIGKAVMKASTGAAARTAIGAGTSSFSGAYGDLTGKPAIPAAPTWANISGKPAPAAAIADLAAGADAAAITAAVNKAFAALRTFGVIAK